MAISSIKPVSVSDHYEEGSVPIVCLFTAVERIVGLLVVGSTGCPACQPEVPVGVPISPIIPISPIRMRPRGETEG